MKRKLGIITCGTNFDNTIYYVDQYGLEEVIDFNLGDQYWWRYDVEEYLRNEKNLSDNAIIQIITVCCYNEDNVLMVENFLRCNKDLTADDFNQDGYIKIK